MFETSKDILLLVIAFCVLLFTLFSVWGIYYVVVMLRNASKMVVSIREKLETVDKILKLTKEKLEKGSNHMSMLADSAIKLTGFFVDKHKKSTATAKKSRKR
jgi:hypothetical protein